MEFMSSVLLTLSLIFFISYSTITSIIITNNYWWPTGFVHLLLAFLTIWSLMATKLTDPGYVSSMYYSEKQEIDIEKTGDPLSGYQHPYIISNA